MTAVCTGSHRDSEREDASITVGGTLISSGPKNGEPTRAFVDWDPKQMKDTLQTVYEYRSKALHGGIPFPTPMCVPPHPLWESYHVERPGGLAFAAQGGIWLQKDLPIHFHIFAYIVRGALLKWWQGLAPEPPGKAPS